MRAMGFSLLLASLVLVGCNGDKATPEPTPPAKEETKTGTNATTTPEAPKVEKSEPEAKVTIKDVKPGSGPAARLGDTVWLTYTGKLTNGTVFDSNKARPDELIKVPIGAGRVIKGWEKGLVGIKKGGIRTLDVPAALGYEEAGMPPTIPPNADLHFEVECYFVSQVGSENVFDREDIVSGKGAAVKKGSKVSILYTLKSLRGKVIQEIKKPLNFTVGVEREPQILVQGIDGKKAGGTVRIFVPPAALAELAATIPTLQPDTPLVLEVQILTVK